nr:hypothetical protein [Lachnospiraceae bacterium]
MKKMFMIPLMGALLLTMTACGAAESVQPEITAVETTAAETTAAETTAQTSEETATEETASVGLANPWREITEEEAMQYAPNMFSVPEGAQNAVWSVMEAEEEPLVQVMFDLDGNTFTAREQVTGDEYKDISGVYYEWDAEDTGTLAGWGTGLMEGKFYRHIGDEGYTDLATWFDVEIGISYSLTVTAADLD